MRVEKKLIIETKKKYIKNVSSKKNTAHSK